MSNHDPYKDFTGRLKLLISKHPDLITIFAKYVMATPLPMPCNVDFGPTQRTD